MHAFFREIGLAVRMLGIRPGFTVLAVVALALGVGVHGVLFGAVNAGGWDDESSCLPRMLLLGAVMSVLLIAAADGADMTLERAMVRASGRVGAGRRMLLASVLVALVGGALGGLVALWGSPPGWRHCGGGERLEEHAPSEIGALGDAMVEVIVAPEVEDRRGPRLGAGVHQVLGAVGDVALHGVMRGAARGVAQRVEELVEGGEIDVPWLIDGRADGVARAGWNVRIVKGAL